MRKKKVTPRGSPDSKKPMNMGIAEQEQKGVTMPSRAARKLPTYSLWLPRSFRDFSGGKKLRMIATPKMITTRSRNTFIVS